MTYVDGFIAAVPTVDKEKYTKYAQVMGDIFKEYGVLKIVENWGDDVPAGEVTSFPLAVQCKKEESVVFSWVVWPSKDKRDESWQALMDDPRMTPDANPMPFDGKRLIYGGFETIFEM